MARTGFVAGGRLAKEDSDSEATDHGDTLAKLADGLPSDDVCESSTELGGGPTGAHRPLLYLVCNPPTSTSRSMPRLPPDVIHHILLALSELYRGRSTLTPPAPPSAYPRSPPLAGFEHTLGRLNGHNEALLVCALVSREWKEEALGVLYSALYVDWRRSTGTLLIEALDAHPERLLCVRSLDAWYVSGAALRDQWIHEDGPSEAELLAAFSFSTARSTASDESSEDSYQSDEGAFGPEDAQEWGSEYCSELAQEAIEQDGEWISSRGTEAVGAEAFWCLVVGRLKNLQHLVLRDISAPVWGSRTDGIAAAVGQLQSLTLQDEGSNAERHYDTLLARATGLRLLELDLPYYPSDLAPHPMLPNLRTLIVTALPAFPHTLLQHTITTLSSLSYSRSDAVGGQLADFLLASHLERLSLPGPFSHPRNLPSDSYLSRVYSPIFASALSRSTLTHHIIEGPPTSVILTSLPPTITSLEFDLSCLFNHPSSSPSSSEKIAAVEAAWDAIKPTHPSSLSSP